jgi:hypothetical protein
VVGREETRRKKSQKNTNMNLCEKYLPINFSSIFLFFKNIISFIAKIKGKFNNNDE